MRLELFQELSRIYVEKVGGKSESAWLQIADKLRNAELNRDDEIEIIDGVLKKTSAGQKHLPSYRSKVLDLAHPKNPKIFAAARKARVGINDLIAIARGSKTFRDGKVTLVRKSAAGGWNEKPATQRIREGFDLAFTAAHEAGIPDRELKLLFDDRLHHKNNSTR